MRQFLRFFAFLIFQMSYLECARILGIFVINSRSHHSINQPILKGLASKGHEVTVISHFKSNSTIENFTEILIGDGLPSFIDSITIDAAGELTGIWQYIRTATMIETHACLKVLNLDHIKNLINSDEKKIDILFVEVYHTHCYHLLAHKLDVPVIAVSPPSIMSGLDYMIGNPFNPSQVPMVTSEYTTKMNFFQRFVNTFQYVLLYFHQVFIFNTQMTKISKAYFNMELPAEDALNRRTALAFYNNHFSVIGRPQSPNAINIAGIHIKETQPLPKDLKEFVEGAKQGVVLFSFGTVMKASSIHADKLKAMIAVFARIPQRVIWRMNEVNTIDAPENVKIVKWLPQRDLLEHENVIAFISHCGLFGTLEAIYTGTPILAIPFIFDQYQDAKILIEQGAAIYLDYYSLDENTFFEAISEIVNNPKYKKNMQRLSTIFKDRPMAPLETAIYWSEYVIEHKGAPWLRTAAADMPVYKYLLLDVIIFVISTVILFIYVTVFVVKKIFSLLILKHKLLKNKTS